MVCGVGGGEAREGAKREAKAGVVFLLFFFLSLLFSLTWPWTKEQCRGRMLGWACWRMVWASRTISSCGAHGKEGGVLREKERGGEKRSRAVAGAPLVGSLSSSPLLSLSLLTRLQLTFSRSISLTATISSYGLHMARQTCKKEVERVRAREGAREVDEWGARAPARPLSPLFFPSHRRADAPAALLQQLVLVRGDGVVTGGSGIWEGGRACERRGREEATPRRSRSPHRRPSTVSLRPRPSLSHSLSLSLSHRCGGGGAESARAAARREPNDLEVWSMACADGRAGVPLRE